jgi:hypothetical protein
MTLVPNFVIPSKDIYCNEMQNVTKLNAKVSSLLLIWVGATDPFRILCLDINY